jgi:hypothetical protein
MNKYDKIVATHPIYNQLYKRWNFLLQSYIGGMIYRKGQHLTRYIYETDSEFEQRLIETPVDNQCRGVIQTYISFLFREEPDREFGQLATDPGLEPFLQDADLEGRSLNNFMKDVSSYASVFGHVWIIVSKPNSQALTRADELGQGIRPYVSMISPLNVLSWNFRRNPSGVYELDFLRYQEEDNGGTNRVIKEWSPEFIITYTVNDKNREVIDETIEENGLGKIPAVIAYNLRSPMRGVGLSDIEDIADTQRDLYQTNSEIIQLIRLSNHPTLCKTSDVEASAGAGSIIQMPDNLDPGLKPYLLQPSGGNLSALYDAQKQKVESIDRMASLGSIRSNQAKTLSGVAMDTEFQMLSAKLSEKADALELAEEQIWRLWAEYQGKAWDGEIDYPDSFSVQDKGKNFANLQMAKSTATDPIVLRVIDAKLLELMDSEKALLPYDDINPIIGRTYPDGEPIAESLPPAYMDANSPEVPEGQACSNCEYYKAAEGYCIKFDANVRPVYWCAKWEDNIED